MTTELPSMPRPRRLPLALALAALAAAPSFAAKAIADLATVSGKVEVRTDAAWREGDKGTALLPQDRIRTGKGAVARIQMRDGVEGAQRTQIDLVPETEVSLEQLTISKERPKKRTGFLSLVNGAIKSLTKGWSSGSVFSVKSGTTVCGIRGSETYQDGTTLVMLGGQVFKLHWKDKVGAMRLMAKLAQPGKLPKDIEGVQIQDLPPGYVGTFTKDKNGRTIAREVVLPPEVFRKLKTAFQNLDTAIASGKSFDVKKLMGPVQDAMKEVRKRIAKAVPKVVKSGGKLSPLEKMMEDMRKEEEDLLKGFPIEDRFQILEEKTDILEDALKEMETQIDKEPVIEDLQDMLDQLKELEKSLLEE